MTENVTPIRPGRPIPPPDPDHDDCPSFTQARPAPDAPYRWLEPWFEADPATIAAMRASRAAEPPEAA